MWYQYMYILPLVKWHVSNCTYITFWHCEKAIILKTKPTQKRNIFCHLCINMWLIVINMFWYAFMFWKNCIYVISIVNFISVHSVYMNLLYIRIFTMNKVQRAIKHVSVTYLYIFMEMPSKFATECLTWVVYLMALLQMSFEHVNSNFVCGGYNWWLYCRHVTCTCKLQFLGRYIWQLYHKCHLNMWTPILGGIWWHLMDGSAGHVIWTCELQFQGVYLTDIVWKFELILGFTLASQRSFLWKTNNA